MAWLWQESSLEWSLVATLHGAFGPEEFQLVLRAHGRAWVRQQIDRDVQADTRSGLEKWRPEEDPDGRQEWMKAAQ